jgi:hypothetical protein
VIRLNIANKEMSMNIVRYAFMALAVSFASVAFGRLKLEYWPNDKKMSFTEGTNGYFSVKMSDYAVQDTYIFIN